jgi:predicted secreted Zn-dependent protease
VSTLDDAARAVGRVAATLRRELENPTEWISGEHGASERDARRMVDHLIAAVRAHDAEIARDFAEQEDGHLNTLCASTYVKGIRDTADRLQSEEGQ